MIIYSLDEHNIDASSVYTSIYYIIAQYVASIVKYVFQDYIKKRPTRLVIALSGELSDYIAASMNLIIIAAISARVASLCGFTLPSG